MQTKIQTPASANACTPLQRVLSGAPLAEILSTDFKKGTWTFKVGPAHHVAAGQYVLLPAIVAQLAIDQEVAETVCDVRLTRARSCSQSFRPIGGQPALQIEFEDGGSMVLYRDLQPPRHPNGWHPAHWRGSETLIDQQGKKWSSLHTHYVQDDFGMLVQVAA